MGGRNTAQAANRANQFQREADSFKEATRPGFLSGLNAQTGELKDSFKLNQNQFANNGARGSINQLQGIANTKGLTRFGQSLDNRNNALGQRERNDLRANQANLQNTALSNLARTGGFDQGSRLRLAQSGNRDLLNSRQRQAGDQSLRSLGIVADDENRKLSTLRQLPSLFQSQGGVESNIDKFNLANKFNSQQALNNNNLDIFGFENQKFGTQRESSERERNRELSTKAGKRANKQGLIR